MRRVSERVPALSCASCVRERKGRCTAVYFCSQLLSNVWSTISATLDLFIDALVRRCRRRSQRNACVSAQRPDLGFGLQVWLRFGVLVHVQCAIRQVLLVPRVVLDVFDRQTLRRIGDEDLANEICAVAGHRPLRDLVVEVPQTLADLIDVLTRVFVSRHEWVAPDHHHVQQHAAAPDVGHLAVVGVLRALAEDHLRCQIRTRSDNRRRDGVVDGMLRVAEVTDLDQGPGTVVEESVLELDVAIGDVHTVAVVESDDQLLEEPSGQRLGDASVLTDVAHEVAAGCVLHDDGEVVLRQEDALELDDVVVQEVLVVENLALDVDVDARAPGQEFNGDLLVGLRVLGEEDKTERAAVQFADFHVTRVVVQRIFVFGVGRHYFVRSGKRRVGGVLQMKPPSSTIAI